MYIIKKIKTKLTTRVNFKDIKTVVSMLALFGLFFVSFASVIKTIAQENSTNKSITAFTIANQIGDTSIADNEDTHAIFLTMPFGTDLSSLTPSFTTTGISVKVGDITQDSGITTNDFTSDVVYVVTAEDETYVEYLVTVAVSNNATPVASDISITGASDVIVDGAVLLAENENTEVVVTATVTDANGRDDIENVRAKIYRTAVGSAAEDNASNHYTKTSDDDCVSAPGSDNTKIYTCTFQLSYYAEATDATSIYENDNWTYEITPADESLGVSASGTIEMATLLAMSVTPSIEYGPFSKGTNTLYTDQVTTIINTGNSQLAVQVFGYGDTMDPNDGKAMVCESGTVPLANERYATVATTAYDSKTPLTDTAIQINDFFVAKKTVDNSASADVYWGFGMPAEDVAGSCHGTVIFTPILNNPS